MKISVCVPSYKRPKVETFKYIPFAKVFVDEGEYDDYIQANKGYEENIISVRKGVQGNLCRIRNYIIDTEFESGVDVVVIVDDDMKGIYRWYNKKRELLPTDEIMDFIYRYSILAMDLGAYFWGINVNTDKQVYREYTPFSTVSYIGGPFQAFIKDGGLRYDEKLPLKEDYDMTLQQLNKFRKVLRVNAYHYDVKQSEQKGGCATYRNYEREEQQLKLLQKKWGSRIVKIDGADAHNMKKKKTRIDYNPIINVPIKGI